MMAETLAMLDNLRKRYDDSLPKHKKIFLLRARAQYRRIAQFYGAVKMHKDPIKMRPVISQVASMLQTYSMWVDRQLQLVLPLCHTRLPDSQTLVDHLHKMGPHSRRRPSL